MNADFAELKERFYAGEVDEVARICQQVISANGFDPKAIELMLRIETACGNAEKVARLGTQLMSHRPSETNALLTSFGFEVAGDDASAAKILEMGQAVPGPHGKIDHEQARFQLIEEVRKMPGVPRDPRAPEDRDGVDIITVLFDEKMSVLAHDLMLPSLYTNSPDLLHDYKIRHYFYTASKDVPLLTPAFERVKAHGVDVTVDTTLIDGILASGIHASVHLHMAYRDVLYRGYRDSRPVLIAPPDHFFGFGLERQLARLPKGGMVVAGHPRVHWETGPEPLKNWLATAARTNGQLAKLSLCEATHPMVAFGLSHKNPYWQGTLSETGASIYFKEPPPLLIDPVPDLIGLMDERAYIGPYQALDHDMVEYAFRTGRLAWVDDSDDFFWCELTSPDQYNPTFINLYLTRSSRHFQNLELKWRF